MSIPEMDMNPEIARKLLEVGEEFRIEGPFFSYEEIKMGNVNHTYKVNYIRDDGTGMAKIKSFLLQRVNTYAFQHPIELMQNIDRVTEHIREKCPNTKSLHFHHTKHGVNYLMDNDGFWRLSNYVPSVTFDTCDDLNVVRSAGEAFGDFQLMLADFDANSLFYTIPNFHNTRKRYEKLKEDMAADPCGRVAEVREELDWLLSVEDEACRLTDLFEKGELPLRVTHNDTKINNVLFEPHAAQQRRQRQDAAPQQIPALTGQGVLQCQKHCGSHKSNQYLFHRWPPSRTPSSSFCRGTKCFSCRRQTAAGT